MLYTRVVLSALLLLLSLIDTGARWHQRASVSNNKRNTNLHSIPFVC